MNLADRIRAQAHAALARVPGPVGAKLRGLNESLGRPLAAEGELVDRRAFVTQTAVGAPATVAKAAAAPTTAAAPVVVYCMDKSRRDATKLTDMLDAEGIPHQLSNIQEDPAAQMAVKRDSQGYRLPLVFIAGEAIGGRAELANLISTGELKNKVFGS